MSTSIAGFCGEKQWGFVLRKLRDDNQAISIRSYNTDDAEVRQNAVSKKTYAYTTKEALAQSPYKQIIPADITLKIPKTERPIPYKSISRANTNHVSRAVNEKCITVYRQTLKHIVIHDGVTFE